ncbi:MAG: glycosyltransferase family 2 protein [Ruminococcus sp.]
MKISIITTVYKAENDLPRLLDSMMKQKSPELEFFLIDNGSPDKCGEICLEYARRDSRFTVYTIKENVGYIRARNIGMQVCDGDYIGFCDSDDYLEPGGYDRAVDIIKETDCDLYITAHRMISGNSETVRLNPYPTGLYKGTEVKEKILPQAFGILPDKPALDGFAWKQLFRKSIISDNRLEFIPELQPYEDQIFNIDVIEKCNSIYVDDSIIYNYLVNKESITAKIVANFDAGAEWNRVSGFWKEKRTRATEPQHILACSNQALLLIYSMLRNMSTAKNKSLKDLAKEFDSVIDKSVIEEIADNASKDNGAILNFVKYNLKKEKYKTIFFTIRIMLKILKKNR